MSEGQQFTVGGSVSVNALYVERRADHELLELCRAGDYAFILSSRQVGKSSLMLRTAQALRTEGFQCVTFSLEYLGKETTTAEQFYHGILHELQKQLQFHTNPRTWWQARAHLSFAQRFSHFFGEVLLQEVADPIVVFIDEIDTTLGVPYSDDFFAAIRALYNARADHPEYQRLSFVLIGVATPTDLIKDHTRTPFNVGKRVEVTDFIFSEALTLIEGFDFSETHARQVLQWIFKWTKGHPYLTQRFCRAVAEDTRAQWSEREIDELAAGLFMGRNSRDDSNLDFVQRSVLRYEREEKRRDLHLLMMQTYKDVLTSRRPIADEEKSPIKSELKLTGIIQRQNGHLIVRNPIYQRVFDRKWIDEHWPKLFTPTTVKRLKIAIGVLTAAVMVLLVIILWKTVQSEELAKENEQKANQLALSESRAAEQARKDKLISDFLKIRADSLRQVAVDINAALDTQRLLAELAARKAIRNEQLARQAQANEAWQRRRADSLAQINLTRFLSTRAPLLHQEQAGMLGLLLARQAFLLNQELKADLLNEVYHAMRKALNGVSNNELGGPRKLEGPRDWAMSVAFSADLELVAASSADSSIWVWELNDPKARGNALHDHEGGVTALAFHPRNRILASGGEDRTVRLWDLEELESKSELVGKHEGRVWSLAFNARGDLLASGGTDRKIRIWKIQQAHAQVLAVLEGHRAMVRSLAFSGDGHYLASGGADSTVRIWDLNEHNYPMLKALSQPSLVKCLAFNPRGDTLAVGGSEGLVRLWNLQQALREERKRDVASKAILLRGHEDEINTLAFSPSGHMLASGSADNTVRLWDVRQPQASPIILLDHKTWIWSVAFSREGEHLLSAASDRTVLVWNAQPRALADLICAKTERNLTLEEWNYYLGPGLPYQRTCERWPRPVSSNSGSLSNK